MNNKVRKVIFGIALSLLILLGLAGYGYYDFVTNPPDIGIDEIGKRYTIVIEEEDINDYRRLDYDDFDLLKDDEVKKLKDNMVENELTIKSGEYLVNQIYVLNDFLDTFEFEESR